MPAKIVHKNNH